WRHFATMAWSVPSPARMTTTGMGPTCPEMTWPGTSSSVRHTTCFMIAFPPLCCRVVAGSADQCGDLAVQGLGVLGEDLSFEFDGDAQWEGFVGGVEIPVGVVGGETEELFGFDPFDELHEPFEAHLFVRLGGEA